MTHLRKFMGLAVNGKSWHLAPVVMLCYVTYTDNSAISVSLCRCTGADDMLVYTNIYTWSFCNMRE